MQLADIHLHALYGVDDGARTAEEMYQILDASYADGIRCICLTPHFHPGFFGHHQEHGAERFDALCREASERYPGLRVYLANELCYDHGCAGWLASGECRTIGGTRYVLVDFLEGDRRELILNGLHDLLNAGYHPVLAHAERYRKLRHDLSDIADLRQNGVVIQINAGSVLGRGSFGERRRSRRLLDRGWVDLISSDAHNVDTRPPGLSECHAYLTKKYGNHYADLLCGENAFRLLEGQKLTQGWS